MADISELQLEQDGYVRQLEQVEEEMMTLENVLRSVESIQEIVCDQHVASQEMFRDTTVWNGNYYSKFYEDYSGVYMAQYQNYIDGIENTISDVQTAYYDCQMKRDAIIESEQEIARKIEMLPRETC